MTSPSPSYSAQQLATAAMEAARARGVSAEEALRIHDEQLQYFADPAHLEQYHNFHDWDQLMRGEMEMFRVASATLDQFALTPDMQDQLDWKAAVELDAMAPTRAHVLRPIGSSKASTKHSGKRTREQT
jgi:hypothetical protein